MPDWTADTACRLDVFLALRDEEISRVRARDMVKGGLVLVNGRVARKPALILSPGDLVHVSKDGLPVTETRLEKADLKLKVLYEDDACFVIDKPAGLSVHPGAGMEPTEKTVLHGIAHLFAERKIPFSSSAVLVHRLDKETTGALLVAKTVKAHELLQRQFAARTVHKLYLAITAGVPVPDRAVIDAPIGRSVADRTKMGVTRMSTSREARTSYAIISATEHVALVQCELHTGRTHQIRVHLQAIGHPLLGDDKYHSAHSEDITAEYGITALCLHAWKLTFRSPDDGKEHAIEAKPPKEFMAVLKRLGLSL
jgi:23S rRNA pseudouridine1911/1915/1917 synthase